jgi:hypothetical protein
MLANHGTKVTGGLHEALFVVSGGALLTIVVSYSPLFAQIASPAADTPGCAPVNNTKYICPAQSPEDLVPIPGTRWLFASSFRSGGMGIRLIDTGAKTSKVMYTDEPAQIRPDKKLFPNRPGLGTSRIFAASDSLLTDATAPARKFSDLNPPI